jgi:putative transcriptional regulator
MQKTKDELEAISESPLTHTQLAKARRVPRIATLRRALSLTQEEFATRYGIPVGTLRDWEQSRSEPDAPAKAYLRVIAAEPEMTARVLAGSTSARWIKQDTLTAFP